MTTTRAPRTETVDETRSICGVEYVPNCDYCGRPLTSNEFDHEPGGEEPGFYSAHSRCSQPSAEGRYGLQCVAGPAEWVGKSASASVRRFTTRKRAQREAETLTDANEAYNGGRWEVVDLADDHEHYGPEGGGVSIDREPGV